MIVELEKLKTISQLAAERNIDRGRITFVLATRRIDPLKRIGNTSLYGPLEIQRIDAALRETSAKNVSHRAGIETRVVAAQETR